jgi:hypothetical protein
MDDVRWNEWNLEHTAEHGVTRDEVEAVIHGARHPYPEYRGDGKWLVLVRGSGGRFIQVIYVIDEDGLSFYPITLAH